MRCLVRGSPPRVSGIGVLASSVFPVASSGNVWIYGYSPPTQEYRPGTAYFCLVSGATGRPIRKVHFEADGACITLMDNPANLSLFSTVQDDCSAGTQAVNARTGQTKWDGANVEAPLANGPDGAIYFNPVALGKVSRMSPPKWARRGRIGPRRSNIYPCTWAADIHRLPDLPGQYSAWGGSQRVLGTGLLTPLDTEVKLNLWAQFRPALVSFSLNVLRMDSTRLYRATPPSQFVL